MRITSVKLKNFKAFENYSLSLGRTNILVGPNNSGKSTILGTFRILEQALRIANRVRPYPISTHTNERTLGHVISESSLPVSVENVQFEYNNEDSVVEFRHSSGNLIFLYFPAGGGVTMYWDAHGKTIRTPAAFRRNFPINVQVIPVLGPVEQDEKIVTDETVRRGAGTPRASRHFRNYWRKNPEGFDDFKRLIENTWTGMSIKEPELVSYGESRLSMFVYENKMARELYWTGLGFQIWCQLLTHIARCSNADLLVVDEPEVYLHPEVQRQLLDILREVSPDILLATHSVEILSEAEPNEILLVDKKKRSARRVNDIEGIQNAIDNIGSIQNVTLTELARNGRLVFVEGLDDYKIIRRFAKILGHSELASGSGLTPVESGGFGSWKNIEALAWGFERTLGPRIKICAIYDRDYRSEEEIASLINSLGNKIDLIHFHKRKEIENYLLCPPALDRAIRKAIMNRSSIAQKSINIEINLTMILETISEEFKLESQENYARNYQEFMKNIEMDTEKLAEDSQNTFEDFWKEIETRLLIIPGKKMIKKLRACVQDQFGVTLTNYKIISEFKAEEVPADLLLLIQKLNRFVENDMP